MILFLEGLCPDDFGRILERMHEAYRYVPDHGTHIQRVSALMRYVRSTGGPGIERLLEVVAALFPSRFVHLPMDVPGAPKKNAADSEGLFAFAAVVAFELPMIGWLLALTFLR